MQDMWQAIAFIDALTLGNSASAIVNWRCIHDQNKGIPAHTFRGTLAEHWQTLCSYNAAGYGIFAVISEMDGNGNELSNVQATRAHYIDMDNVVSAAMNLDRARAWYPAPSFAVQSSPGKYHVYWPVTAYRDNDRFQVVQRKLRQMFDGDKAVSDATRVMRVPGTLHCKAAPSLVTCFALPGYGYVSPVEALEAALAGVNVIDGHGGRQELGDPSLAAPSLGWIQHALALIDPNKLDRGEWISITAAVKQAGWTLADEATLYAAWAAWCARYDANDEAENLKQWNSIRNTETGWRTLVNRAPGLKGQLTFNGVEHQLPEGATPLDGQQPAPISGEAQPQPLPMPAPPELDCSGEILTYIEQQQWFKGCVYVDCMGEVLTPAGRFMGAGQFNGSYGGKQFIISSEGKLTDEPWKAATRSTLWTVPKVDHIRFLPEMKTGEIVLDALGRKGVNTYIPININSIPGDVLPWLRHMELMLPVEGDRKIFFDYLAHNVKFPGFKIPWAPMLQSTEGVGKGFIMEAMETILGDMYVYSPKAEELVKTGSTFNAWMRAKLMIIVNEIKVDERRELIEILKPMITDKRVEVQGKGENQAMEDNCANWLFFSNYKDAIPINKSSRRYAIFYSAIQSPDDLLMRGMNDAYFTWLFGWLRSGGAAHVAHWLLTYPIERGNIPMRAPETSSKREAELLSRGPLEQLVADAIEDGVSGLRGGWISVEAVLRLVRTKGGRVPSHRTIAAICESMGYTLAGRSVAPIFQEDAQTRSTLYHRLHGANVAEYAALQGYM